MRSILALTILFASAPGAPAFAGTFSVSGAGGAIPDYPVPGLPGAWNNEPVWPVFTSTVSVSDDVTSITSVTLSGLTHTWRGDLHAFLTSPGGTRINLIVRPGYDGSATGFGDGGDYVLGDYVIVETGGSSLDQGASDINGGVYDQYLNTGAGMWTSGSYAISNAALSTITGTSGTWTLTIVDWGNPDAGSLTGWTLNGTDTGFDITPFCFGDGSGGACPCGNDGAAGHGCENSISTGGAELTATGNATLAADTVVLTSSGERPTSLSIVLQGDTEIPPTTFGDGLRCVGGNLKRLYVKNAVGGVVTVPEGGDLSVSARSADLNDPIPTNGTRTYLVYYRDPNLSFCASPTGNTFNSSNGMRILWGP